MLEDIPEPPRWRRIALGLCIFLIIGVFGFLQPFVSLYLTSAGLSKVQFGIATALGTGLTIVIQPILGRLSDRFDTRRPFMVFAAVTAGFAYLSYRLTSGFWPLTLLTAVGVNGYQYLNSVGGVLVARMTPASAGRGAAWVRYRFWGSVGYILIAIGAGLLVKNVLVSTSPGAISSRAGLDPIFHYGPLLFFMIAVVALFVPDRKAPVRNEKSLKSGTADKGLSADIATVGKSNLNYFLAAFFLYQFALYGASAYLPLYMTSLGATPMWVTAMFATGAVSEATVMTFVGRWTDRHGRRPALATAFLVMPLRLLLYIPAPGPYWVLVVQMLHGFNFGIMGTIAVVFVNEHAGEFDRGSLQSRMAATIGLGLALGPLTCGYIAQHFGLKTMFGCMSAIGVLAAIVFFRYVRESHPSPVRPNGFLGRLA